MDPAILSSTPHLHTSHSTGSLNLSHSHWAKSLETLATPQTPLQQQQPSSSADPHYFRGIGHFQEFGGGWPAQMNSGVHLNSLAMGNSGRFQPSHLQIQQPGMVGGQMHPFMLRDMSSTGPSAAAPPPGFNPLRSSKTVPEVTGIENL
ncbi:hypothetical protein J437_LFUL019400 [Ladona fulva]|uniref:Uncharacterized protein n=1 Tax=Ladona fulva TaxID=123851 RepID=A0A8K0K0V0_LADFU|nr:hypothetical protein J437_LFUL019400 [Ladona fulva]